MTEVQEKETKWYDAWVRWERGSKETYNDGEEEDEDDQNILIPTKEYEFQYGDDVWIKLSGFHADSEAIWSSTGLTLWRSSEYLCEYLISSQDELLQNNIRLLELGSGLGRCGILAHLLCPSCRVMVTDGDTDVLAQLRANIQRNQLKENDERDSFKSNISSHQLLWGEANARSFLDRYEGEKFDVIIGSDLIYVPNVIQPLFESISVLLKQDGQFIMAHCARRQGNEVTLEMIFNEAKQKGLNWELLKQDDDIYLYSFCKGE